jgi:hypothetical protein
MASRSRSMSFTTVPESAPLSMNRAAVPFPSNSCDRFSIFSNALQGTLRRINGGERLASILGQLSASLRLLRVPINRCCGNVLFEPVQQGYKVFHLLLDIFKMLGVSVSVVCGDHPLEYQYLVVLDQGGQAAEGRFEGRVPVG